MLLRGILLLAATAAFAAVDVATLKPEGYVSDFSHVVDGSIRAQIERYAQRLDRAAGVQLAFVTIDTLEEEPVEDFANRLYRAWGIGKKGQDEGALVLLVVRDHRSRIEVGKGLEPIITDGTSGGILREMRPALRANDFGDAMMLAAQRLGERIAQEKGIKLDEEAPKPRRAPDPGYQQIPWPVLLFGALLLFWLIGGIGRRGGGGGGGGLLTGMILGNMMGRGMSWGGGGRGGGFGGYDSGDSFGGFGGGDSGGGGASSDW